MKTADANQRHRQSNVMMTREEPESESRTSDPSYNQDQFLKPHQNVNITDVIIGRVIGEGDFGKVYKASRKGQDVAVKVLMRRNLSADVVLEFES
ncbi:hypothetical protein PsorP6_008905 [Peronosclerospora sorghi]|uniref:Uncharacterized protein n=1 Tax=Peronosclerospora sorghi TaxID=230839 RepID=A0ACC0VYT5_9STRA|nr:hypothetical protein PsorP6_008905 [Peronosclerospora sorghi]